jgi:branched-chain amino acid transport system permease protein
VPIEDQLNLERTIGEPYHERMRARLIAVIGPELVAEHRRNPAGQHSDALRRVLTYFGNTEMEGKLIIEHDGYERWYVCRLVDVPAGRVQRIDGPLASEADALHAVFLRRLTETLGLSPEVWRP